MNALLARRLGQSALAMLVVTLLAFLLFRFLGDPIVSILGPNSTGTQRDQLRHELGLDGPLLLQFLSYLRQLASGDFGISYRLGQPVGRVLLERAPASIELALCGIALALLLGIPAGIYSAINRHGTLSRIVLALSLLGISMPSFFMGVLLIWTFSIGLGWLPSFGRGDVVRLGWWTTGLLTLTGLKALVMPTLTIAVFQVAMLMRMVRAEMLEVMRTEFVRFAKARGLSSRAVHLRHALRNTLLPVVTITGLQLGSIIGFAVITEFVFQWPGLGLLFLQSVGAADVPMLAAYLLLIALLFSAINLMVDLLYAVIDPRLRPRPA